MDNDVQSEGTATYYANPRSEMLALFPPGVRRVLEVGCGNGEFGAALKRGRQIEVVGVELVPAVAEQARRRLDWVIAADIERAELDLAEASFDCLVCNDVLEHLADPWQALTRLRRYVAPDGWLVASIPNVRHHKVVRHLIWPGEWRYEADGILDRTHLRFFTRGSARAMIESAGFRVVREQGINRSSLPLWLSMINSLSGGAFEDMRYLQFAFAARRTASSPSNG